MPDTLTIDRAAGAATVAAKALEIALAQDVQIVDCVWDFGADLGHEHAHRVDLVTAEKSVRIYFTELELTTTGHTSRAKRMEERLQRSIAQLLQRAPAPTYGFR